MMQNIDHIENRLIGTCIAVAGQFFQAADYIHSHLVFRSASLQIIWKVMQEMERKGMPIEITTLSKEMERTHEFTDNSIQTLVTLTEWASPTHDIEQHCKLVLEDYMRRECKTIAGELRKQSDDPAKDIFDLIEEVTIQIESLTSNLVQGRPETIGDVAPDRVEQAKERVKKRIEAELTGETFTDGIPSGIRDKDEIVNGYVGGRFYVIAARPGMGKSAITANNICMNAAKEGEPSLFKSLEMPSGELTDRMLCSESGVSYGKFQKGFLEPVDVDQITEVSKIFKQYPIFIEDKGGESVGKIRAACRKYKREFGIKMLVVDNINLIQEKGFNRENQMANISRGLKRLAIELDIPVIAISHLNRGCEGRDVKEPMLSDLRDSGAIEQDADCVIFIYRPMYYGFDYAVKAHPETWSKLVSYFQNDDKAMEAFSELSFAIIAKNRGLRTGRAAMRFIGRFTKFYDWEDNELRRIFELQPRHTRQPVTQTHTKPLLDESNGQDFDFPF